MATGTGDLAILAARAVPGVVVVGVDPSRGMLGVGREKVRAAGLEGRVVLLEGDAQGLPFADGTFDAVSIAFGIRNVSDRPRALGEMLRVLRPGGRLAILELGEPRRGPLAPLARFHVRWIVPRIGALLSGAAEYRYLQESIAAFPEPEEFAGSIAGAGFEDVSVQPLSFGACNLYLGRRR